MKVTFRLIGILLVVTSLGAFARETLEIGLSAKNEESDLVIIGVVTSVPTELKEGHGQAYVTIKIEVVLKGHTNLPDIKFIVRGFSDELNPRCCEIERRYLIFAKEGFDVFSFEQEDSGEFGLIRRGRGEYYSGVNGPYSTYLLENNE